MKKIHNKQKNRKKMTKYTNIEKNQWRVTNKDKNQDNDRKINRDTHTRTHMQNTDSTRMLNTFTIV